MLLIPETYNCAIHKLITGFIKMLIYGLLQAVWSGQRTQVQSLQRLPSFNPVSLSPDCMYNLIWKWLQRSKFEALYVSEAEWHCRHTLERICRKRFCRRSWGCPESLTLSSRPPTLLKLPVPLTWSCSSTVNGLTLYLYWGPKWTIYLCNRRVPGMVICPP